MMSMRFNADGTWDKTYGTDGLTRIDIAGDADRGRNLAVLPDGRILVVGQRVAAGRRRPTPWSCSSTRTGSRSSGFGTGGQVLSDLGGPGDAWFGVVQAADGKSVTVVGYKGADPNATDGSKDDAADQPDRAVNRQATRIRSVSRPSRQEIFLPSWRVRPS